MIKKAKKWKKTKAWPTSTDGYYEMETEDAIYRAPSKGILKRREDG